MPKRNRIPKTIERHLYDLDHHLFILREQFHRLTESESRLKVLAAELRVLLCKSSGTDGLLWRLAEKLKVNDQIDVQAFEGVNTDHPHARGLHFALIPFFRSGFGPPDIPSVKISFEEIVKTFEAVFIGGKGLTHEYIIKAIAQQMGSAHEDEGLEPSLVGLNQIFINGVQPYIPILAHDAEFTLEIGERILEKAEQTTSFKRLSRDVAYGNVSVVLRISLKKEIVKSVPLFSFRSFISNARILALLTPQSIVYQLEKLGNLCGELEGRFPSEWGIGKDGLFVLSYCSSARKARILTNSKPQTPDYDCDFGWIHAGEMTIEKIEEESNDFCEVHFLALYEKLLSSGDAQGLLDLIPDESGNWWSPDGQPLFITEEDSKKRGVFPD